MYFQHLIEYNYSGLVLHP